MKYKIVCPACKEIGKIYGLPYGLQIMSSEESRCTDVHMVILVHCEACGAVLGAYRNDSKPESRQEG